LKLSKILSSFSYQSHLLVVPFILFVYGFDHFAVWGIALLLALRLLLIDKRLCVYLVIFMVIFMASRVHEKAPISEDAFKGVVVETSTREYSYEALVKTDQGTLKVTGLSDPLKVGDRVRFKGTLKTARPPLFMNGFDYDAYLKSQGIKGIVKSEYVQRLKPSFSIHSLRYLVQSYFETTHKEAAPLMQAFILADNSKLDETMKDKAAVLGVSHLFAVSGLHVAFMLAILYKGMGLVIKNEGVKECVAGGFLGFYVVLSGAPPSVLRAATMAIFLMVVKRFKIPLSGVDGVSLLAIGILLIRPYALADMGFVLSFLVSFTLMLASDILKGKSPLMQGVWVSLLACLVTMPIVMSFQFQVNLLSIIYNVFFVWGLMFLLLPLVYLTAFLPILTPLLLGVYTVFEKIITVLGTYGVLPLEGYIQSGFATVLYLGFFVYAMNGKAKRSYILRSIILLAYLLIVLNTVIFSPFKSLTMFAVDGDSILLEDSFNRCNILVDTGNFDDNDKVIKALKRKNIKRLDYVFISHEHSDHYGEYEDIYDAFKVTHTVSQSTMQTYEGTMTSCGSMSFYLFPLEYEHGYVNNRSLVLYVKLGNKTILFTGDMERARELTFLKSYQDLVNIDILKAPHHGSNSSNSDEFLEAVNAEEVLVSAHPNNTYGHPNKEVINKYKKRTMIIHRTDERGSVELRKFMGKWIKKTAVSD